MNLVACPSCSCHFDVDASACPHCGDAVARGPNGQIARTAAAVAFGLASVALPAMAITGCGDSSGTGGAGGTGSTTNASTTASSTKSTTTGATTGTSTSSATTTSVASAYGIAATSTGSAGTTVSTGTGN